jgi:hypothetical protein
MVIVIVVVSLVGYFHGEGIRGVTTTWVEETIHTVGSGVVIVVGVVVVSVDHHHHHHHQI